MVSTRVRRWCADTMAMIILSTVVGMMIEIGISRYTLTESLRIRGSALIPNLLTASMNGRLTDAIRRWLRATPRHRLRYGLADVIAFTTFQVPLYAVIQVFATWPDPHLTKIMSACSTVILVSTFIGVPYGRLLDICRRLWKVDPTPPPPSREEA